ncbi:MAG TPA: adenylyltransferase/cytidyltransferase family protein, partial [Thermoplasmata archaeon]|nr:adenylyltransferase/cytidyltransferase family protein [Thermoplasmata archaeon]
MVRVMATGVFDLLHPGHVAFLREAKALGDELVVVVARDSTAKRFKHTPITPEAQRV